MPEDHMNEVYNSKNRIVSYVHRKRLIEITKIIPNKELIVLDAGCGEGHLLEYIGIHKPKTKLIGVDITKIALISAKKRVKKSCRLIHGDLTKIPLKNDSVDVITCTETLEHITQYLKVFSEFERILKPGGILITTVPNETTWTIARFILRRKPVKVPDHVNSFTPKKMRCSTILKQRKIKYLPLNTTFWTSFNFLQVWKKIGLDNFKHQVG